MGNVTLDRANHILSSIDIIYNDILEPLKCVSQTIILQLDKSLVPINLLQFMSHFNTPDVNFNPELFPAISLHCWRPVHVNLFSSGKIVVLGKDSITLSSIIYEWIYYNVMLYL